MTDAVLHQRLMELAEALEVDVREVAAVDPPGGSCVLRGKRIIMVSQQADLAERIDLLARTLARVPGVETRFVLPQVRDRLDRARGDAE